METNHIKSQVDLLEYIRNEYHKVNNPMSMTIDDFILFAYTLGYKEGKENASN